MRQPCLGFRAGPGFVLNQTLSSHQADGKITLQVLATQDSLHGTTLTDQGNTSENKNSATWIESTFLEEFING